MIEDKSFNAFLKAKLEEDLVVPAVDGRACVTRAPKLRSYLLAASLAIICGIFSWQFTGRFDKVREQNVVMAIALLDDSEYVASADTFADKLLAWQDAPFGEIEN